MTSLSAQDFGAAHARRARCGPFVMITLLANIWLGLSPAAVQPAISDRGALAFASVPQAKFKFGGVLGQRLDANVNNWLLRAPQANPGMLEMFRLRDRQPAPNLVP